MCITKLHYTINKYSSRVRPSYSLPVRSDGHYRRDSKVSINPLPEPSAPHECECECECDIKLRGVLRDMFNILHVVGSEQFILT